MLLGGGARRGAWTTLYGHCRILELFLLLDLLGGETFSEALFYLCLFFLLTFELLSHLFLLELLLLEQTLLFLKQ